MSLALPASHGVHAEARAAEYEPTGQLSHEEAPAELRVPAGQSVQPVAARSLDVPAAQTEAVCWPVAEVEVPLAVFSHEVEPFRGW